MVYNNYDQPIIPNQKFPNQNPPTKLYQIVYVGNDIEIPVVELLDSHFINDIFRDDVVSTDISKLKITLQKLQLQYPYDHLIIREKFYGSL